MNHYKLIGTDITWAYLSWDLRAIKELLGVLIDVRHKKKKKIPVYLVVVLFWAFDPIVFLAKGKAFKLENLKLKDDYKEKKAAS